MLAPFATSVAVCPVHTPGEFTVRENELTTTPVVAVLVQPDRVPATLYVAATVGDTVTEGEAEPLLLL